MWNKCSAPTLGSVIVAELNDWRGQKMTADIVAHRAVGDQDRKRWWALGLIVAAQFMVVLDVAIVNVALPSIRTDLNFSQESLQWVITAYAIFFGGFLLLGGRLADLLGRRRLFVAGLALFTVMSLLDGLAWSEGSLITFRALQGLGAAMLSPAALSILTTTFREGQDRNLARGCVDAHHVLLRGQGPHRRARHLGRGLRQRWRSRRAARRCPDQRAQLV